MDCLGRSVRRMRSGRDEVGFWSGFVGLGEVW